MQRLTRRKWPWVLLALLALVVWNEYRQHRPRLSLAQQAAHVSARLAQDPATAPAEADMWAAYQELLDISAAPDRAAGSQEIWLEGRVDLGGTLQPSPSVTAHAAALRRQVGFWRTALAARPTAEDLVRHCVYQAPYTSCRVASAGEVEGTGGTLRYQLALRFMTPATDADAQPMTEDDYGAVSQDSMVGAMMQVFAPAPQGGWRMVLAADAEQDAVPTAVETPAGRMLRWTEGPSSDPATYVMATGHWRWLYDAPWRRAVADRAPPGTCLRGMFYVGNWPFPDTMYPELSRRMVPDLKAFTYDDTYYDGETPVARVHATLGVDGRDLVLRTATVDPVGRASLLARLLGRCG